MNSDKIRIESYPEPIQVLIDRINRIYIGSYNFRTDITELITDEIISWASMNNWGSEREFEIYLIKNKNNQLSRGKIDLVLDGNVSVSENNILPLAIEIDRGDKNWSIEKLQHCQNLGFNCLWIRWGKKIKIDVPEGIWYYNFKISTRKQTRFDEYVTK